MILHRKLASNALKTTSKTAIQKIADAILDLLRNKIAEKIAKFAAKSTCEDPRRPCIKMKHQRN